MLLGRRQFLRGLFAAPAIIKVAPLMRLSVFEEAPFIVTSIADNYTVIELPDVMYQYLWIRPEWVMTVVGGLE